MVIAAAIGLVVGLWSGAAAMSTPTIQAPHECTVALNVADKTFVDYENVATAMVLMSTRGKSAYEGHEADANRLWDEIDEARRVYDAAKATCLGDS